MNKKDLTYPSPCPHCGNRNESKWCYEYLSESGIRYGICNRDAPPAPGWQMTQYSDADGKPKYCERITKDRSDKPSPPKSWFYQNRKGSTICRVDRTTDQDGNKKYSQSSLNGNGNWIKKRIHDRSEIPIYRYQQVREAIAKGDPIFVVEGEKVADVFIKIGLTATTNIGGSGKWRDSDSKDLEGASLVVLCPDRDKPGVKHMEKVAQSLESLGISMNWLYAYPHSFIWDNLPDSQGLDAENWISDYKLNSDAVLEFVIPDQRVAKVNQAAQTNSFGNCGVEVLTPKEKNPRLHYTQEAVRDLYSDVPWCSIKNRLHRWNGNSYEPSSMEVEKGRIAKWCSAQIVARKNGYTYAYATPAHVDNIFKWAIAFFAVDPDIVNPPGLNCLNGTIRIFWDGNKVSSRLIAHDPSIIYTYCSQFEYDPDADPTECDRLLECLEPEHREMFLRTMSASLDLQGIRKKRNRPVKALLCKGQGSNGKDTLREVVGLLYSVGLVSATVNDFKSYDQGRKFTLSKLLGSRINWASENSSFNQIDNLQSLKAAITGDPVSYERKGVDEQEMKLSTIFLFNVNEAPNLNAASEAIKSRWGVLPFNKVYVDNPDPVLGQLKADSRFREDPEFILKHICPAFLNKMLEQLQLLVDVGIDYDCSREAIEEMQSEGNHLWEFVRDLNIVPSMNDHLSIPDLWIELQEWYKDNGTLEIVDGKRIWTEQARSSDYNVKGVNQLFSRLKMLFPHVKKRTYRQDGKRFSLVQGLVIQDSTNCRIDVPMSSSFSVSDFKANLADFSDSDIEELEKILSDLKMCRHPAIPAQEGGSVVEENLMLDQKEQKPVWVRYRGDVYMVAYADSVRDGWIMGLRESGFKKIVYKSVHSRSCSEVSYDD